MPAKLRASKSTAVVASDGNNPPEETSSLSSKKPRTRRARVIRTISEITDEFYNIIDCGKKGECKRAMDWLAANDTTDIDCSRTLESQEVPLCHRWACVYPEHPETIHALFHLMERNGGLTPTHVLACSSPDRAGRSKSRYSTSANALYVAAITEYSVLPLQLLLTRRSLWDAWNVPQADVYDGSPLMGAIVRGMDQRAAWLVEVSNDDTINRVSKDYVRRLTAFSSRLTCPLREAAEFDMPLTLAALLRRPGLKIDEQHFIRRIDNRIHVRPSPNSAVPLSKTTAAIWDRESIYPDVIGLFVRDAFADGIVRPDASISYLLPKELCELITAFVCSRF